MEVIVKYSEIALKGNNFPFFQRKLIDNIRSSCKNNNLIVKIAKDSRRIICNFPESNSTKKDEITEKIKESLSKVFGIHSFAIIETTSSNKDVVISKAKEIINKIFKDKNVKELGIKIKRADKTLPYNSVELSKEIGEEINKLGRKVNLSSAKENIHIDITKEKAYFYSKKIKGLGGMPVGTSGKVLLLLSGGIDSAVAAWLLMKRGCQVDFLHIHSFRENKQVLDSKIKNIANILQQYQSSAKLYLLPYAKYQIAMLNESVSNKKNEKYDLVVFKHFILKFAEKIAEQKNYPVICTGDSLAQVASQTLDNLKATSLGVSLPILRPLLTYDKQEIIDLAKVIDTYQETIKAYKDCCSIIAKKPSTSVKAKKMQELLSEIDINKLVEDSMKDISEFKA